MLIRESDRIRPSEVTGEAVYLERRRFLRQGVGLAGAVLLGTAYPALALAAADHLPPGGKIPDVRPDKRYSTDEPPTSWKAITTYNNFYEFGTGKSDPEKYAGAMRTRPWTIEVRGECDRPGKLHLEDFLGPGRLQDRVYRHRCVEAWSMVIPWVGVPLADILRRFRPNSRAKYVAFTTLYDPTVMPGQRTDVLDWPYHEGLRMDEAMHPLTLIAVGVYGKVMPNQNGAPLRLVVPWKYGFKSIKSIVRMTFTEKQPETSWHKAFPGRYGFYSNVNPHVDRVPWSQAYEVRIGHFSKQPTKMFNGYADQVAHLYAGMNLRRYY